MSDEALPRTPSQPRDLLESHPDDAGTIPAHTAPGSTAAIQLPPWIQLIGLPLAILFAWVFARAASHAVVVFIIATIISLLLAPVVRRLSAAGMPRLVSVFLVFAVFVALVAAATVGLVDLLAQQAASIQRHADDIARAAVSRITSTQQFLDGRGVHVDLRDQGVRFVQQLQERSTEISSRALEFGSVLVTRLAEAAFNVVLVVVISIYMLLDGPRISRLLVSVMPRDSGVELLFARLERSLFRYVVGQTLASLVMGVSATLGLWALGWTGVWPQAGEYAVLMGIVVAVTEFAPSVGPVVGSIPPIITAFVTSGVGSALAVMIFFVLLHQLEGHIVIPKLMGAAIAVHPLLVIFGILAGAQIMGIGGILLALPLLAVIREIVVFLRERIVLGPWTVHNPVPVTAGSTTSPMSAQRGGDDAPASTDTARRRAWRTWPLVSRLPFGDRASDVHDVPKDDA